MTAVIRTEALTKHYGDIAALVDLDLEVHQGEVFGFLGPNGAGKTTAIRLLVDLLRPTSGRAEVLGADPIADGVALRRRIGYLPGEITVDERLTGFQMLTWFANLRGRVDADLRDRLINRLDADPSRPLRNLSKGNKQKFGLIQAFMHRPELLILDEPSSGLDPLLQAEFLAIVRETVADGATVFLSSHLLSEVEAICERVGMIRDGRLAAVDRIEDLRAKAVRHLEVHLADGEAIDSATLTRLPGVSEVTVDGSLLRAVVSGEVDPLVKLLAAHHVVDMTIERADLEAVFMAHYTGDDT